MLLFALYYTRRTTLISLRSHILFSLIPAITAGLVLVGDPNSWVWRMVTVFSTGDFHALDIPMAHGFGCIPRTPTSC